MNCFISHNYRVNLLWRSTLTGLFFILNSCNNTQKSNDVVTPVESVGDTLAIYHAPDTTALPNDDWGKSVKYGYKLIYNTAYYLGPDGTVGHFLGNKMNCTNCHLNGGSKAFGLNYFDSHKVYPQYRAREDKILTLGDRVNNCIERPHNGTPMPLDSREMVAILSYMKWIGEKYDKNKHEGFGLKTVNYENMSADPQRGAEVYATHCKSCHQADGQGQMDSLDRTYVYPPLWGSKSYQTGSSMHRVLKAAAFIKYNMPNGTDWRAPKLNDQEALDVAAFINDVSIHPRPNSPYEAYHNLETKNVDYFRGPYLDTFSERQHTFGPWTPIERFYKERKEAQSKK